MKAKEAFSPKGQNNIEGRRLETQAAVSQMKERLRVMGLLESSVAIPKIESQLENLSDASSVRRKPSSLPAPPTVAETPKAFQAEKQWEPLYPPPPPLEEELTSQGNESKQNLIAVELRRKAVEYKRVLRYCWHSTYLYLDI